MKHDARMARQTCTYSKLDFVEADPEVYKRADDLKLLIEPQTPQYERVAYAYPSKKVVKKIKKKKRVLSTLDILISIFIVTPCVVGCWRGTWQIMDIYAVYFPAWESFFLGMVTHIVLALGQDVFHHVVVENESRNPFLKVIAFFLMKFYTITFNVISNMVWRAGWMLFDRYCGVQISVSGSVLRQGSETGLWFTVVCALVLICLKGLKNTLSPPFSIALDSKDEVFLFSTRYIYKASYCIVVLVKKKTPQTKEESVPPEKLASSQSMLIENFRKPPRPFETKSSGLPPQEFIPTTSTATPTRPVKAPPINYPQLTNYRSSSQPKSIQDILKYINSQDLNVGETAKSRQGTSQDGSDFTNGDPFHSYKPSDPSDVNLLATASVRFAPPLWKNFRKTYSHPVKHIPSIQQVEMSGIQETINRFAKPFVVNLNIYPMEGQYPGIMRYGQRFPSHKIQSGLPYQQQGDASTHLLENKSKITIRFNVIPEVMAPSMVQEDQNAESNARKVKFL